ncbi:iron dicitrate transport regulator FecR [Comamonas sp. Tr-654]|uniref:FecR family protein n=1 Tax=Comamonas sp. Tr-654 TaxID=2608341 RepID=UPI001422FD96|nr:FecR domain-containing protein [Comamonas sp. Tr-654]NIF82518.1 iron dicitrate transport regulator FecR [Comamonas sp. Tr-654]
MSHSFASQRNVPASFDEAEEARELADFFSRQNPVEVAAVEWHSRWEQGLSENEHEALRQWLAEDAAHDAAFRCLTQDMAVLRSAPSDMVAKARSSFERETIASGGSSAQSASGPAKPKAMEGWARAGALLNWIQPRSALVAACCAAAFAAGTGWHQWMQPTFESSYVAQKGQQKLVTLPDGSELAMDTDTQAQVTMYRDRREVRIADGQIMFSVAADPKKPFHVLAGPARVTVLGTRFSVRYRNQGADAGAVNVSVEKGHVQVASSYSSTNAKADLPVELLAGQGLRVSSNGVLGQVASVAPGSVALWRKGLVRFDNTALVDALFELERYGSTGLEIRDPAVAAMTIGGSYQIDRPGEFARMLTQILPVKLVSEPSGKTEIVSTP